MLKDHKALEEHELCVIEDGDEREAIRLHEMFEVQWARIQELDRFRTRKVRRHRRE